MATTTATAAPAAPDGDDPKLWLDATAGSKVIGRPRRVLLRMARAGLLRVHYVPYTHIRYYVPDLIKYAAPSGEPPAKNELPPPARRPRPSRKSAAAGAAPAAAGGQRRRPAVKASSTA